MKRAQVRFARWTFFSALSGILAGLAATVFLYLLDWATNFRHLHFGIVWFLPLAGLAIGWTFHRYGHDILPGTNLILDEIHDPKKVIPAKMTPFILIGTIITHLFGGSAGREGTAVQMGASLSDQLSRYFEIEKEERKILLMTGAGAGFGAAIGAPLAGVVFGMEVLNIGRFRPVAVWESIVASLFGYGTTVFLGAPHSVYPHIRIPEWGVRELLGAALVGLACGLFAWGFIHLTHWIESTEQKWIPRPELKPFLAGIALALLFQIPGAQIYSGLGIDRIQGALTQPASAWEPVLKAGFTSLTIGSGFKGGEFIPLVFMGTTLGSVIGSLLHISFPVLAAVGFAALFGAASHTPISCAVMAIEIFGIELTPYALLACFIAYFCSGQSSIYKHQHRTGKAWWMNRFRKDP